MRIRSVDSVTRSPIFSAATSASDFQGLTPRRAPMSVPVTRLRLASSQASLPCFIAWARMRRLRDGLSVTAGRQPDSPPRIARRAVRP